MPIEAWEVSRAALLQKEILLPTGPYVLFKQSRQHYILGIHDFRGIEGVKCHRTVVARQRYGYPFQHTIAGAFTESADAPINLPVTICPSHSAKSVLRQPYCFCTSTAGGKACNAQSLLTTDKEKSFRSPAVPVTSKSPYCDFHTRLYRLTNVTTKVPDYPKSKKPNLLIIPHHLRPWPDWRSEQQYISSGSGLLTDFSCNGYKP